MPKQPTAVWQLRSVAKTSDVFHLVSHYHIPPEVAHLLAVRGFSAQPELVLGNELSQAESPSLVAAAERIQRAIAAGKRIVVHGDYDADGITGSAILYRGLGALGANIQVFIPNRLTDGYGIAMRHVPAHAEAADLLITVDCGISNAAEIRELTNRGTEVIVTDHHQAPSELPECLIVHPAVDQTEEFGVELTGAGVAFHLLWHVHTLNGLPAPQHYTDLAAIGTVADVAPLLGQNRALVARGTEQLAESRWPGIHALARVANVQFPATARDIAFLFAPRINSSGRLGEGMVGFDLLRTDSTTKAEQLAIYIDALNQERRELQDRIYESAAELVDPAAPAIVLNHPDWHSGVVGIVASKLLDRFYKPVYLAANGRGSVRSTPGISAVNSLHAAREYLAGFGGHPQAAGFGVREGMFASFADAIQEYVKRHPTPVPVVELDGVLTRSSMSGALFTELERLEPYGEGFTSPRFAFTGTLESARAAGAGNQTLLVQIDGVRGVAWQQGHRARELALGKPVLVAASLQKNTWRGRSTVELLIEDIREGEHLHLSTEAPGNKITVPMLPVDTLDGRLATVVLQGDSPVLTPQPAEVTAVKQYLSTLPTVHTLRNQLRNALRTKQANVPEPYGAVLRRLGFITETGEVHARGRAPYTDEQFVAMLAERYRLESVVYGVQTISPAALPGFLVAVYQ